MSTESKNQKIDSKDLKELSDLIVKSVTINSQYFETLKDSILPLKQIIESQKNEIDRLKKGYDFKIKKSFIMRLIDMKKRIDFFSKSENEEVVSVIKSVNEILDYMFKVEGIQILKHTEGELIDKIDADEIEIFEENALETNKEDKIGRVISTIENGYFIDNLDGSKLILKKSIISFYKKG